MHQAASVFNHSSTLLRVPITLPHPQNISLSLCQQAPRSLGAHFGPAPCSVIYNDFVHACRRMSVFTIRNGGSIYVRAPCIAIYNEFAHACRRMTVFTIRNHVPHHIAQFVNYSSTLLSKVMLPSQRRAHFVTSSIRSPHFATTVLHF